MAPTGYSCVFGALLRPPFRRSRHLRVAVASPIKFQAVGAVAQPVQRGRGEQSVRGEALVPFIEIQVARNDGCRLLVPLGNDVVQVYVGGSAQWLESDVVNDEQRYPCDSADRELSHL